MSSNNLYRKLQQLRLRPGKDVEITSSFYGSVIHIKNQPSAVYGAYRGPFSVILSGADSSQPPEILITDLTYQESNGKAGEIKMFNYRVIKVPETKLPLNECDIYLHIYYDTESKSLTAEFYPIRTKSGFYSLKSYAPTAARLSRCGRAETSISITDGGEYGLEIFRTGGDQIYQI